MTCTLTVFSARPSSAAICLLQQAIGQAQQHAELLGRELRQAGGQFGVGFRAFGRHGREPATAVEHGLMVFRPWPRGRADLG